MTIKSILVHLDPTRRSDLRLEIARGLGERFRSTVTGLFAITPYALTVPTLYSAEAVMMLQEIDDQRRERARAAFDTACGSTGCEVAWAELNGISAAECVVQQSRYADLLLLGQRDPDDEFRDSLPLDFVETVLLQGGRPALVLPYAGVVRAKPERIVVAWNGSPESARAVTAAIPFMQGSSEVRVLAWGDEDVSAKGATLDIERYLQTHGVTAKLTWSHDRDVDVGNTLLNAMADYSADLLVMGCYGHSRAREWALGGATRTVLRSMTAPVLMCH